MFYFTIARHGETVGNVQDMVQSRSGGELTDRGTRMAKCLGQRLENERFTHIFSSDLNRCQETTRAIVAQLKMTIPPVEYTAILQERDYGDFEFQPCKVVRDKMSEDGLPSWDVHKVQVPNGESYEKCKERAGQFFKEILTLAVNSEGGSNVLAVTHGIFILTFFEYLLENSAIYKLVNFNEEWLKKRAQNTSISRFSIEKVEGESHEWQLNFTHFNDSDHLKLME